MKKSLLYFLLIVLASSMFAQNSKTVPLPPPDTDRGLPLMKAMSLRASATDWDSTALKNQDLSDLLWAANGINRPETGKRTAPSAHNAQDIDIYVCMNSGVYLYNAGKHQLEWVLDSDCRALAAGVQKRVAAAPVNCLLVSDTSRFKTGDDAEKLFWAAADAGIVSQNISLFCASVDLATRPRALMDHQKLRQLLKLKESQLLLLNHPVSNN